MKKLLAIAIAAGLAAPMAVMADTTVYGKMKVSVGNNKDAGGASTFNVNAHSSRIGLKGSMPMDNGMSVTHKVELATAGAIDGGLTTHPAVDANGDLVAVGVDNKAALTARDAWVGLKGGFGEVRVGRHTTPLSISSDMFDIMNVGGHAGVSDGPFRIPNAIAYLKGFGPIGIAAAYVPDEDSTTKSDIISLLGTYKSNGIKASLGHQKAKGGKATNNLGLGYTFPAGHQVNYVYNNNKGADSKASALNGRYKFGKAYVQAELGKVSGVDGSNKVVELGYGLGKGTTVWGSLGKNNMNDSKASHARVGITSNF